VGGGKTGDERTCLMMKKKKNRNSKIKEKGSKTKSKDVIMASSKASMKSVESD